MARIGVVAQNFDIFEGDGLDGFARTGNTSASQILRAGAQGVILGHSEAGDGPETVHKKLLSLIGQKVGLKKLVILVGEGWDEYENSGREPGKIAKLVEGKCERIFSGVPEGFLKEAIIGYEPKWGSKGSGRDDASPPQPEVISACIGKMRDFFGEKYGNRTKPGFIYGGRSTPERTEQILADENVDGLILGSACNTVEKTMEIARIMGKAGAGRKKVLVCNFKAYELQDSYGKYIDELGKLPEDFLILLAPPYTDIRAVRTLLEEKGFLFNE